MMQGSFVLDPNGEFGEEITTAAAAGVGVRPRAAEEHDAKAKGSPSERRHRPRTDAVSARASPEPTPTRAERTAASGYHHQDQGQDQGQGQIANVQVPVQVHVPDELPNLPNAIPALHRNLDGAYERLSALLQRERRQTGDSNNSNGGGGVLECHLAKPRCLIRKRAGAAAGGAAGDADGGKKCEAITTMAMKGAGNVHKMAVMEDAAGGKGVRVAGAAEDGPEGRQPADEFDLRQVRRGSGAGSAGTGVAGTWSTSTTDGQGTGGNGYNHPETILRKLLLQLAPDEEVDEVPLSDVGMVYHHAGVDRNGVVGNVHRLATRVFGEGDEMVEVSVGGFGCILFCYDCACFIIMPSLSHISYHCLSCIHSSCLLPTHHTRLPCPTSTGTSWPKPILPASPTPSTTITTMQSCPACPA